MKKNEDTQANKDESVKKRNDDQAPPLETKMDEECNDNQSPPLSKTSITIVGIGHVKILDLGDGLLQFAKLDNTHVWSHKKHKSSLECTGLLTVIQMPKSSNP